MADSKISALTDGGGLQADDELAVNRSATSYKARGVGTDGWISDVSETWTYNSFAAGPPAVGTFKVPGDLRAKYTVGTRLKLTQTTVKYFVVTADPTFDGTNTTVTISGGTDYTLANAAISANYHSYAASPQGYPGWFNFTPSSTGFSSTSVNKGRFQVVGRICFIEYESSGTSNATTLTFTLPIAWSGSGAHNQMPVHFVQDNSTVQSAPGYASLTAASASCTVNKNPASTGWTASGNKIALIQSFYEI